MIQPGTEEVNDINTAVHMNGISSVIMGPARDSKIDEILHLLCSRSQVCYTDKAHYE